MQSATGSVVSTTTPAVIHRTQHGQLAPHFPARQAGKLWLPTPLLSSSSSCCPPTIKRGSIRSEAKRRTASAQKNHRRSNVGFCFPRNCRLLMKYMRCHFSIVGYCRRYCCRPIFICTRVRVKCVVFAFCYCSLLGVTMHGSPTLKPVNKLHFFGFFYRYFPRFMFFVVNAVPHVKTMTGCVSASRQCALCQRGGCGGCGTIFLVSHFPAQKKSPGIVLRVHLPFDA